MYPHQENSWNSEPITDSTVNNLRHRLDAMKQIFGEEIDDTATAAKAKRAAKRNGNCIDNIIDGSFMGLILAVCLTMVLGAAFFAYKNLYFAVVKKMYPDQSEL